MNISYCDMCGVYKEVIIFNSSFGLTERLCWSCSPKWFKELMKKKEAK